MSASTIYVLSAPDHTIRYVGQTTMRLKHRLRAHFNYAVVGKSPLAAWIRESGLPAIRPLFVCPVELADWYEARTIIVLGRTHSLLNVQEGGRSRVSYASRQISAAKRGRPLSREHREAISHAMRGIKRTVEHQEKLAATRRGRPISDDQKQKISMAMRGRPWSVARRLACR